MTKTENVAICGITVAILFLSQSPLTFYFINSFYVLICKFHSIFANIHICNSKNTPTNTSKVH